MPSPILARADALMQRRRSNAEADDLPVLTDAIDLSKPETDEDIPVLQDIEAGDARRPVDKAAPPPPTPTSHTSPPRAAAPEKVPFPTLNHDLDASPAPAAKASAPPAVSREDIARDIARRVQRRLVAELPRLIAAAVTDYLAEQDKER